MTQHPGSILAALALALALAPQMVAPDSPTPAAAPLVLPGTIVLYSWAKDRCAEWDIPDTPARLWRGPDGRLTLIAGAEVNRASVGVAPDALARDCRPRLEGPERADPAALSDRWWLASVHAQGDGRIEALVHAEYHGHAHPGACSAGAYLPCWRNAILAAASRDGGLSFTVDTAHPVAALPYPYDGGQTARSGYFSPSNMILSDGALYAFIFAEAYGAQRRGVCLIRRPVAGGASDWRAWDGAGFTARLDGRAADGRPGGEGPAVCTPLPGIAEGSSLSRR